MLWIVGGQFFLWFVTFAEYFLRDRPTSDLILGSYPVLRGMMYSAVVLIFIFPACAGFYIVSKMILEDHICVRL